MRALFPRTHDRWAPLIGVLCIALVLLSGVIQAAHFHPGGQADHDCTLCVAAHQIAQVATPVTLPLSSLVVAAVTSPRSPQKPRRAVAFRLSIRPPPSNRIFLF